MTQATTNFAAPSSPPPDSAQVVAAAIQEISHIATLPEVTMRIIALVENNDSSAHDLNQVISNDPAMGARILKVVNSAFYGLPGQIGSTNRAIALLGLNAVKNIAIAASLAQLFRGGKICPGFDARDLWNHCIASATATRLLGDAVGLKLPDEAFLAGLTHDIGIMVEVQVKRPQFIEALDMVQAKPGVTLREAEVACIGASHEQFGAALCKQWKFPVSFAYVTGFHHHPMDLEPSNRTLTALVAVADVLAVRAGLGMTMVLERDTIDPALLDALKLDSEILEKITASLPTAMEEASVVFQSAA